MTEVASAQPAPAVPAGEPDSTHPHGPGWTLVLAALGVVFGDIGTSPLYAMQTVFTIDDGLVKPTSDNIYGVISVTFWAILLIVSLKQLMFILRADNDGEGGILSLAYLTRGAVKPGSRRFSLVMLLGVFGASLFFGDSLITPAISVLSAVEGLKVPGPGLAEYVLPIGLAIIVGLFAVQRFGTHLVGRFFGPVMVVWFLTLAALGIPHIIADPHVLGALSPHHAVAFAFRHPFIAFIAMGAVVLAVTGAEALYADMGHFGRVPIVRAWFFLVFPCLTINYLGQAQQILHHLETATSPFFHLAPDWLSIPLVILATLATIIASQAVISGAYSVARQAERLGYLPRLTVRHTSEHESGQIYIPVVNWLLFAGVIGLMVFFQASEKLATAYGVAVTMDLMLTTTLFCVYAGAKLKWARWQTLAFALVFGLIEFNFFAGNVAKVLHGGWLPLLVAGTLCTVMLTWRRGQQLVTERRTKLEGPLLPYLDVLHSAELAHVPGTAIFLHPNAETTPLALRENADFNRVIHSSVVIVSTKVSNVPHVAPERRVTMDDLGDPYDHITHVTLHFGFQDDQDVPAGLALAVEQGLDASLDDAVYFVSRITVHRSDRPGMAQWRKRLFVGLAHNAATPVEYFRLPIGRTVVMGAQVRF
ncbi:potassium transporter Kup [Nostocoides veronense]|uniref:Probable potassium transport system protein Kup n=1 Tax=Nostocoides veronense TaxID=330836 RepID=A0ABN2LKP6_9MICO